MAKKRNRTVWAISTMVITLFLALSLFPSYLSQNLKGFNDLNTTFSIPFLYQILLLVFFVFLSSLYIFKKRNLEILSISLILSLFVFISTYSITFSTSVNSISTEVGSFTINSIGFSEDLVIEKKWYGYLIQDSKKAISVQLLTNLSPLIFRSI